MHKVTTITNEGMCRGPQAQRGHNTLHTIWLIALLLYMLHIFNHSLHNLDWIHLLDPETHSWLLTSDSGQFSSFIPSMIKVTLQGTLWWRALFNTLLQTWTIYFFTLSNGDFSFLLHVPLSQTIGMLHAFKTFKEWEAHLDGSCQVLRLQFMQEAWVQSWETSHTVCLHP